MQQGAERSSQFLARHATVPDAIEGFKSESDLAAAAVRRQNLLRWGGAAAVVALFSTTAVLGLRVGGASNASIQIQSRPAGIQVRINGELRGQTPLALSLAPGTYDVVLGEGENA